MVDAQYPEYLSLQAVGELVGAAVGACVGTTVGVSELYSVTLLGENVGVGEGGGQ
jgi:hypothetical protein